LTDKPANTSLAGRVVSHRFLGFSQRLDSHGFQIGSLAGEKTGSKLRDRKAVVNCEVLIRHPETA